MHLRASNMQPLLQYLRVDAMLAFTLKVQLQHWQMISHQPDAARQSFEQNRAFVCAPKDCFPFRVKEFPQC